MVEGAWDCRSCRIIHRPEVAANVLDGLMRGESLEEVWKKLEEKL
jgi:Zn-finger protein